MKNTFKLLIGILLILAALTSCGTSIVTTEESGVAENVQFLISVDTSGGETRGTSVKSGMIRLTHGNITIFVELEIDGMFATAQVDGLRLGNWKVEIQLYDINGAIVYSGSLDFVLSNGNNPVPIEVILTPHTGTAIFIIPLPQDESDDIIIIDPIDETGDTVPTPILWNRLGSFDQVANSEIGPGLDWYLNWSGIWYDVSSDIDYVEGVVGNCITPRNNAGLYVRQHCRVIEDFDQLINTEAGTIELWYKQVTNPVGYSYNPYRIVDGSYGLSSGMALQVADIGDNGGDGTLQFALNFGGTTTTYIIKEISEYNGEWIHIIATWDRYGIAGSIETMQLYINGEKVASTTEATWGTTAGSTADICSGNEAIAYKFFMDELKIYDVALTPENLIIQ